MTHDELHSIVALVREHGCEFEPAVEVKRAWWAFEKPQSAKEFLKDIAGMANAHYDGERVRHILVGVDEKGKLHEARMPFDEARIQDLLRGNVQPMPRVCVEMHTVEATSVAVVCIAPPFDRPYVVRRNSENVVYIRTGTSIGTVTRGDLDSMYVNAGVVRKLDLEVQALETRRTPHARITGAASSRGPEYCKGRLQIMNVGHESFDVTRITFRLAHAGSGRSHVVKQPGVANQIPCPVPPQTSTDISFHIPGLMAGHVLPPTTATDADSWGTLVCEATCTCEGISGKVCTHAVTVRLG